MENLSIDITHFLLFVIPGFILVWTFRNFTGSKKTGDFEYAGLSFFWGLVMVSIYGAMLPGRLGDLLSNPYAAALGLSPFCFMAGVVVAKLYNRLYR